MCKPKDVFVLECRADQLIWFESISLALIWGWATKFEDVFVRMMNWQVDIELERILLLVIDVEQVDKENVIKNTLIENRW